MTTTRGYAHYAGLLPVESSDEPPPLRPTILEDPFPDDGQPSLRKRGLRALSRFLIAFWTGVAAILAWQSYGDAAREMIASSYPQLSWLAPQARLIAQSAPNIALAAPAAPSFDHQQLSAMSLDLNAVRQGVDRIDTRMAGHELILRSIDQIATRTTAGQERMTPSTDQTDANIAAGQEQIAGSIDQTVTNSAQAPLARAPAAPPPPAVSYTQRRAWDSYVPSTRRNIHRNLLMGSDGTYKVVATDHDAAGTSNGGSVCIFNAGGWSDCVSSAGDRYQLKPASIRWFVNIANGAAP